MKKLTSLICLIALFTFSPTITNAQRFGTSTRDDNTGRVLTYAYSAPSFTATLNVNANAYETTVRDTLTGAQTITATVTRCKVADKLRLIFCADGTDRIVTFSTGFTTTTAYTVTASTSSIMRFSFNGYKWAPEATNNLTTGLAGDGTAGAAGIGFTSDPDNGFYRIGANHWASTVAGTKQIDFNTTGVAITGTLSATGMQTPVIQNTGTTYTATGTYTVSSAELATGLLVAATSTATTTMVLPTAALMATQFSAVAGTILTFYVLNNGASNGTVTVAVSTGGTASGFPGTNTLTLAGSATVGLAGFRICFLSATAYTLTRVN